MRMKIQAKCVSPNLKIGNHSFKSLEKLQSSIFPLTPSSRKKITHFPLQKLASLTPSTSPKRIVPPFTAQLIAATNQNLETKGNLLNKCSKEQFSRLQRNNESYRRSNPNITGDRSWQYPSFLARSRVDDKNNGIKNDQLKVQSNVFKPRLSANPAFFIQLNKKRQKSNPTSQSSNCKKLPPKKVLSDLQGLSVTDKSEQNNQQHAELLNIPARDRTATRSLRKFNNIKKNSKVPSFIRQKQYAKSHKEHSMNMSSSNEQIPCMANSADAFRPYFLPQSTSCYQITINIKPAMKKRTISDFSIIKQIGEGSFGKAFIAIQRAINFVCVLKQILKQKLQQFQINNLVRQIKLQTALQHQHITKLYGYFDDQQYVYLIMELLPTGNLKQKSKTSTLTEKQIACITAQICSGISYMHAHEIIHRDIKPENIFTFGNYIKLGDLGCAVYTNIARSSFVGSPCYLSPEQLRHENYDKKVDTWELGTLIYELMFKVCPFQNDIFQMMQGMRRNTNLSDLHFPSNHLISQQAKDFMTRCLDKDPATRMSLQVALSHRFVRQAFQDFLQPRCMN